MNMYAYEQYRHFLRSFAGRQGCVKRTSLAVNVLLRYLNAPSGCTNEEESRDAKNMKRILCKLKIIFKNIRKYKKKIIKI